VSYYVPFTGDKELLKCRPNSFSLNPPHARIAEHELIFEYDLANGDVASTKSSFEQELRNVRQWIQWNTAQVEEFNSGVQAVIRQGLSTRLQRLQESKKQVNDLGFKVRPKVNNIGLTNSEATQAKAVPQSRTRRKSSTKVREYDVALSFAGEDREYVDRVAGLLREAEVKVFYDGFEEVNLWGKNLADYFAEIYAKRSKFVVIFVSQHYAAKAWPNHERKHAQARAIQQQEDIVLPARFDDTELPGLPSSVAYLDLRKLTPEDLAERIIKKLQH
jgi:hypothetical protein